MKKILFISLVSLSVTCLHTNAQKNNIVAASDNYKPDANLLFKKSKNQKNVAWLLLGAGIISTSLGSVRFNPDGYLGGSDNSRSTLFLVTGLAAVTASIPLFISSAKNKRKASLMVKNEPIFFNPQLNLKEHLVSLGAKINL